MERNEMLDKFFEYKCKQTLLKLWMAAFAKPGYTSDEVDLCLKHASVQSKLGDLEEEMMKFLVTNRDELLTKYTQDDLKAYCQEYKVSMERQRELSVEVLGKGYTVEELIEKAEARA
jgi:hypothetical protein